MFVVVVVDESVVVEVVLVLVVVGSSSQSWILSVELPSPPVNLVWVNSGGGSG